MGDSGGLGGLWVLEGTRGDLERLAGTWRDSGDSGGLGGTRGDDQSRKTQFFGFFSDTAVFNQV